MYVLGHLDKAWNNLEEILLILSQVAGGIASAWKDN